MNSNTTNSTNAAAEDALKPRELHRFSFLHFLPPQHKHNEKTSRATHNMKRPALAAAASLALLALVLQPAAVDAFAFPFAVGALLKPFVRRPPPPAFASSSVFPPPNLLPQTSS